MSDAFERQLGDLAWAIATGLRAAYSLPEVLEVLAQTAPPPVAGECQRVVEALRKGADLPAALIAWQLSAASAPLRRLIGCLAGGANLPEDLDALSAELLQTYGSDSAFYPALREEAAQLGAQLPERVRLWLERSNPA